MSFGSCTDNGGSGGGGTGGGGAGGGGVLLGAPMDPPMRIKLNQATIKARNAIEEKAECAELFSDLGADGITQLGAVTFRSGLNTPRCDQGARAWTHIYGSTIYLCPVFTSSSPNQAGGTVIHELLHTAGLGETNVLNHEILMTSGEINDLVREKCGL